MRNIVSMVMLVGGGGGGGMFIDCSVSANRNALLNYAILRTRAYSLLKKVHNLLSRHLWHIINLIQVCVGWAGVGCRYSQKIKAMTWNLTFL